MKLSMPKYSEYNTRGCESQETPYNAHHVNPVAGMGRLLNENIENSSRPIAPQRHISVKFQCILESECRSLCVIQLNVFCNVKHAYVIISSRCLCFPQQYISAGEIDACTN